MTGAALRGCHTKSAYLIPPHGTSAARVMTSISTPVAIPVFKQLQFHRRHSARPPHVSRAEDPQDPSQAKTQALAQLAHKVREKRKRKENVSDIQSFSQN
jgi:hypothetical protein